MKAYRFAGIALLVASLAADASAEEVTLQQAVKIWSFLEGNWTLATPEGMTLDVNVHLSPARTAYISESKQGLHIFGWDPKTKRLEIQSFMPDGARGSVLFDRKSDNRVSGAGGKLIAPDGSQQILDEGTFTIVSKDEHHFTLGDGKWVSKRK